jgi:hypothetical protein
VSRSDLTPRSGRGGDRLAAASPVPSRLVQRSGAPNHGPKIFHAYRFAPDHKLINLEAANAQLLSCGVADSETTHGHRAYRECTNGCRASGQCARGQRPQRNPAGGDAPDSDASNFDGWQICDCTFCAMHDVLPAHNVLPLPQPLFG